MAKDVDTSKSVFDGGMLGYWGMKLLYALISTITLSLALPWAACMFYKWEAKHTTVDGRQLVFDGTGGQLFGTYIKWFLLIIVTIGIYALWIPVKMKAWRTKHTHFAE